MLRRTMYPLLGLLSVVAQVNGACSAKQERPAEEAALVKVNDTPITERELQASLRRTFGEEAAASADAALRSRALDALVTTRSLALAREAELDQAGKDALQIEVEHVREELLVKQYLAEHAPPASVSGDQAQAFYREHPDRFGAMTVRRYELISSERELNLAERDGLLKALAAKPNDAAWSPWTQKMRTQGFPVAYSTGLADEQALHASLRALIRDLPQGQPSPVNFVQGRAYVVRVTGEDTRPARPFADVEAEIKAMLAPTAVKRSLELAQSRVANSTRIVRGQ